MCIPSESMRRWRLAVRAAAAATAYSLLYMMFLFCLSKIFSCNNTLCTQRAERRVIVFGYETRAKVYVSLADSEYVSLNFKDVFSRTEKVFFLSSTPWLYRCECLCRTGFALPLACVIIDILYFVRETNLVKCS